MWSADIKLNSKQALLLYPRWDKIPEVDTHYIFSNNKEPRIDFKTINLKQEDIKKYFNKNDEFIETIKNVLGVIDDE